MKYQALARKWRPKTFQQVVAQQHVLAGLINSLDQQRLHHAYLFSGTRGVGKTTIARLFAKSLNCELGVSSQPCGQCSNCIEVDQGNFVDLLEIDAASRTKVEDTRELLDNVQYSPAKGRYKVYLIDEVHMLSRHSFNALLKTLEEPPEHVKFLLATTDPQKLPVTVLSRCLQFHLKALSEPQIAGQLAHILDAEQRGYQLPALNALAHAADGSMRDALSLTDQALALCEQTLEYQQVLDMLGVLDPHQLRQLLCHVVAGQSESAFNKIAELASMSPDYEHLHQQLAELIHHVAMAQVLPASQQDETIQMLAEQVDAQLLQLLYQIVITGKRDLAYAPNPRTGFEMSVLRMLAFQPAEQGIAASREPVAQGPDNSALADSSLVKEQQEILAQAEQQGYQLQTPATQSSAVSELATPITGQPRVQQREQSIAKLKAQLSSDAPSSSPPITQQAMQVDSVSESSSSVSPATDKQSQHSAPATNNSLSESTSAVVNKPTVLAAEPSQSAVPLTEQQPPVDDSYYAQLAEMDQQPAEPDLNYAAEYAQPLSDARQSNPINSSSSTPVGAEDTASLLQLRSQLRGRGKTEKKSEEASASQSVAASSPVPQPLQASETVQDATAQVLEQTVALAAQVPVFIGSNDETWANMVSQMNLGPIARQIAINTLYSRNENAVQLLLKPEFKNLLKPNSVAELKQQLSTSLQAPIELVINIGEDGQQQTPLELQQQLHAQNIEAATQRLLADPNIQILQQRFGAQLVGESVKYH
ncbi:MULTISPECIES: DNA polymerase III subunit gamma/tau [unclassified Agarivorans]|uniref:DNA polymerase III subunit gamma/tau n=1 Tax=unclassified Agarivorans TaxID=2636026 RepID=UPI003D7EC03E